MEEKEIIRTIYHENVKDFFKTIKLNKEFNEGKLVCRICGNKITNNNFRIAKFLKDKWIFCCDGDNCLENLSSCFEEE